jgi:hypothetical protein
MDEKDRAKAQEIKAVDNEDELKTCWVDVDELLWALKHRTYDSIQDWKKAKKLLSTEETLKEIDEMMEFLRKLSVIYQRDPESFPADLLQKVKELIAKAVKKLVVA